MTKSEYMKKWWAEHPGYAKMASRKRRQKYPESAKLIARRWRERHPERARLVGRISQAKRRRDPAKRLANNLRAAVCIELKKNRGASGRTVRLLGCSIASFKIYLESKFEPGMTWENYGKHGWHVDHIMPCAIFDLSKPEHQRRCFHFSNMQPMWATENWSKNCKVLDNQFNLL